MDPILVKILATALTLSQVVTRQDAIKTTFDPARDRGEVVTLLKDGCKHMRRSFGMEALDVDELVATAMSDPQQVVGDAKAFRGIDFAELHKLYGQFCGQQPVNAGNALIGEAIEYYNKAVADLPDHTKFEKPALPGMTVVLDHKGERFSELYEPGHRRVWVPLSSIPDVVRQAFVSAEDKRFFEHRGIDERAVVRAFVGTLAGQRQGGSTITQQVAKNLLVGDDVTYDRKMREMIVASRLERTLPKQRILELYLNSIYLGRGSWGIEMAAQSHFGKPASRLTLSEAALLAAITKGPNFYAPDRHPDRARQRYAYVLSRMQEDGAITADQFANAVKKLPALVTVSAVRNDAGFHFLDHLSREAKSLAGVERLTAASYTVRTTINADLQRATETALQDGLNRYERSVGRTRFLGAEANLAEAVKRNEAEPNSGTPSEPAWQRAFRDARLPLYDVHWTPAVVIEKTQGKNRAISLRAGLKDGRVVPLSVPQASTAQNLQLYDVVYVSVAEAKGKTGASATLRVRPLVQGAAAVIENKTGRILAMTGGFSYPLSQLNRATQTQRQPGSALKPLTYLAALSSGLQPNTLLLDEPVTLPPVGGGTIQARAQDYWSPRNYDRASSGPITLRTGLESSKNLVTAQLLNAIAPSPEDSLTRVCNLALEAQLYKDCVNHYPFVLGAQPVRLLDLAALYAGIANEGARPSPHAVETIEQNGSPIYRHLSNSLTWIGSADRTSFFQLKALLQGVLERGTATSIKYLAPYAGGKTGTTDGENDAWFVGFTNDVTIAVWVGYDNAEGVRRTLGSGQTGAKVAIPIFESIIKAAWLHHAPRTVLSPASPEAQRRLVAKAIDLRTGDEIETAGVSDGKPFLEHFRTDFWGRVNDTQYKIVSRDVALAMRPSDPWLDGEASRFPGRDIFGFGRYAQNPWWRAPAPEPPSAWRRPAEPPWWDNEERRRRERRIDPDYFWGLKRGY